MGLYVSPEAGDNLFTYPNRVDLSVNNGRVTEVNSPNPVLHCATGGNVAGGYNGGGVGNKAILGLDVLDGLGLASLVSLSWTYTNLTPYIPVFWPNPYANLIIDLLGTDVTYKVGVIDPQIAPALSPGSSVVNPDGSTTWTWLAASNAMLLVGSPFVPVIPITHGAGAYPAASYSIADILSAYPAAKFRRRSSLDGGLPKTTVTPAFMIVEGDSGNNVNITMRMGDILVNGANV